jgi:hypothetical protein
MIAAILSFASGWIAVIERLRELRCSKPKG